MNRLQLALIFLLEQLVLIRIHLIRAQNLQPCVFEYNSTQISQGEVYSPNYPGLYPNNLNCRYEFYGRENELIILQAEDFQLESAQNTAVQEVNFLDLIETVTRSSANSNSFVNDASSQIDTSDITDNLVGGFPVKQCFYDFLDIFTIDKQGRTDWRSRHCGATIDQRIVSTSPTLIMVFQTDRMLSFRGFKFKFHFSNLNIFPLVTQPICGQSQIDGSGGVLTSPNYPQAYPANAECAWVISAQSHQTILVKFDDVNLSSRCKQSYVRIYDGYVNDINKPDLSVCEKLKYYHKGVQTFYSKTNRIVISFVANKGASKEPAGRVDPDEQANSKNEKLGFKLTWTAVHLDETCEGFRCKGGEYCIDEKNFLCQQTYKYCIAKELVCDGMLNCDIGDKSDELYCQLVIFKPEFYAGLSVVLVLLLIMFTFCCYLRTKLKRRNYLRRLRNKKSGSDEMDSDNIETEYKPHKKIISMPMPNYIDFNMLKDNSDLKQDDSFDDSIINIQSATPNSNNKASTTNFSELKTNEIKATSSPRLKLTRDSIELNLPSNKNEIPVRLSKTASTSNRHYIVRQTAVPVSKETWLNQHQSHHHHHHHQQTQNPNTSLAHQSSVATNSSSLNSVKSDSQQSLENLTDNSLLTTDKTNKSKTSPAAADSTAVKSRNSHKNSSNTERNLSNSNSLRRNSYTKAIFFEET